MSMEDGSYFTSKRNKEGDWGRKGGQIEGRAIKKETRGEKRREGGRGAHGVQRIEVMSQMKEGKKERRRERNGEIRESGIKRES